MELINSQLTCKAAINLGTYTSYGEKCMSDNCKSNTPVNGTLIRTQAFLCGGRSTVLGEDAFDEEICWRGNRVVWSAANIVRRRFTLDSLVLQVAWAKFLDTDTNATLCMLQQSLLTTYTLNGQLQTVPVLATVTAMHPIPQGLLLSGDEGTQCSILSHPLKEMQTLSAEFSTDVSASWQGEHVIWSSSKLPYLATYSKKLGRVALWHIKHGDPALQIQPGLQPRTPAQILRAPPGGIPQSASKRQSLRMADGRLSPAAFSPISRAAEAAAANARAAGLEPQKLRDKPKLVAAHLWCQQMPADVCPDRGHLATDHDGAPLLLLHSRAAAQATALRLPYKEDALSSTCVEVAFTYDAVAVATVEATRKRGVCEGPSPPGAPPSGLPARDILLQHATGRLSLHIGSRHVCNVVVDAAGPSRLGPYAGLIGAEKPTETVAETPQKAARGVGTSPGGSSDFSMDDASNEQSPGGGTMSPGSEGVPSGPNVAGLGDALEAPPEIVDLADAVRDRVTVEYGDGRAVRIALPFTPVRPLPGLALEALKQALDPPVWHALFCSFITAPGAASGDVRREWEAFASLLLRWARDPLSLSAPLRPGDSGRRGGGWGDRGGSASQSTTTDAATPAATPGGSVDSGSSAAWDALLQSAQHRSLLRQRKYPWLRGDAWAPRRPATADSSATSASTSSPNVSERMDVAKALQALHAVYEDFKLNLLRWHLLPRMARLLCQLAALLGARAHLDHYQRDLGPLLAADSSLFPSAHGIRKAATAAQQELGSPADIHRALHAMLAGDRGAAARWLPPLAKVEGSCVSRSVDVAAFYQEIASASEQCCQELWSNFNGGRGSKEELCKIVIAASEGVALLLWQRGWSLRDLDSLPVGVALPLREALHHCRSNPPAEWPPAAYTLVGRADLAAMAAAARPTSTTGAGGGPASSVGGTVAMQATASFGAAGLDLRSGHSGGSGRGRIPALSPMWQPQLRTPAPAARSRLSIGGGHGPAEAVLAAAAAVPAAASAAAASSTAGTTAAAAAAAAAPSGSRPTSASAPLPLEQPEEFYRCAPGTPYTQRLLIPGLAEEAAQNEREKESAGPQSSAPVDGIEGLFDGCELRFGRDKRLAEVRRLLASNQPSALHVAAAPEAGDPEQMQAQQMRLMALGTRTMALPFGRAALTLGTMRPLPTEPLPIPPLCLAGRLPEQQNATVNLDLTQSQPPPGGGAAADITAWPEFHNGVAAGLRMAPGCAQMTRTWIVYNKPKVASYTHAGMIMGLGLTNHLACLSATDLFGYLSQYHDATIMAVLLGMGAAKAGSMDETVARMMSLHIASKHPQAYPELELSPLVQSAALMGIGLLHRGTCHRQYARRLLNSAPAF